MRLTVSLSCGNCNAPMDVTVNALAPTPLDPTEPVSWTIDTVLCTGCGATEVALLEDSEELDGFVQEEASLHLAARHSD